MECEPTRLQNNILQISDIYHIWVKERLILKAFVEFSFEDIHKL